MDRLPDVPPLKRGKKKILNYMQAMPMFFLITFTNSKLFLVRVPKFKDASRNLEVVLALSTGI